MNYEEKYNTAIEKLQETLAPGEDGCKISGLTRDCLEHIFPELKVPEGESIRNGIIALLQFGLEDGSAIAPGFNVTKEQALAWIEKQGANKSDFSNIRVWKYIVDMVLTEKDGIGNYLDDPDTERIAKKLQEKYGNIEKQGENKPQGKTALEAINEEKVDNQNCVKPADKVEPKFHEGEWIVQGDNILKIKCVGNTYYCYETVGGYVDDMLVSEIDSQFHLWTIADAKDGDVVVDKSDGTIGIFQSIGHHPDGGSYNDPSYCFLYCRYDDGFFYADFEHGNTIVSDDLIPATKEQRDLLFAKMKEAGYEWNNEKKELKKIELTAKDLMIGDYVIRKNVPKEILIVDAIDSIRDIVYLDLDGLGITEKLENIEPIPPTDEILEKNGFVKDKYGEMTLELDDALGTTEIVLVPSYDEMYYWWKVNNELITKIKSIHELQHALRLCGIEKTIEL